MKLMLMMAFCISLPAFANLDKAPDSFQVTGGKAIFIDIRSVDSSLDVDLDQRSINVTSRIEFSTRHEGFPLFDLVPEIKAASLNGMPVDISLVDSPEGASQMRMIKKMAQPGEHVLIIEHKIETNVRFSNNNAEMAFWMSDLSERHYLERYLPANLEYDQYQYTMNIKFNRETVDRHEIFTNGVLRETRPNQYRIVFPEYFTASSFYFHMTKKDKFTIQKTNFKSIDGRRIPLTIYSSSSFNVSRAERSTRKIIQELEEKFGAWGHPSLTIYVAGSGGMEYAGATMTSLWALGHELIHSYFARGVFPVRGNAGWIDEAIASWRDDGYRSRRSPGFRTSSMGAHSQYRRSTDRRAYDQGADFMEYINFRLESQGGLSSFLKSLYATHMHQTISTKNLQNLLESYSGEDYAQDFKRYILGGSKKTHSHDQANEQKSENFYHPKLTKKEELDLI